MKFCQYCGRENDDSAHACKGCGSDDLKDTPAPAPSFSNLKRVFLPAFSRITRVIFSRQASFIVFVLAIVCLMPQYNLYYSCGYHQKSINSILRQELLALLGLAFSFLFLFIIWIGSLFRRKHRFWTTAMLIGLLAFMELKSKLPKPHDWILHGMRDGMLRNYGLDDMRHFARDFNQLPDIPENDVDGHTKFYWNRLVNDDLAKTGLKEKYLFLANCEDVIERDGIVHVDWGGFENHWGFFVAVDGKKIDTQHWDPDARIIRVSNDVVFFSDY